MVSARRNFGVSDAGALARPGGLLHAVARGRWFAAQEIFDRHGSFAGGLNHSDRQLALAGLN